MARPSYSPYRRRSLFEGTDPLAFSKAAEERRAKATTALAEREEKLSDPLEVDKKISGFISRHVAPKAFKKAGIDINEANLNKPAAYEALFDEDHPFRGITEEIRNNIDLMRGDKRFSALSSDQIIETAYRASFDDRKQAAYEYKYKKENAFPGFSTEQGPLPGYDEFVAEKRAKDVWEGSRRSFTPIGAAENAAIGAAFGAAALYGSKKITASAMERGSLYRGIKMIKKGTKFSRPLRAAVAASRGLGTVAPHPLAKLGLIALASVGEFALWNLGEDAVQSTDWARARQKEGKLDVSDLASVAAGVAGMGLGTKAALRLNKKLYPAIVQKSALDAEGKQILRDKAAPAESLLRYHEAQKGFQRTGKAAAKEVEGVVDDGLNKMVDSLKIEEIDGLIRNLGKVGVAGVATGTALATMAFDPNEARAGIKADVLKSATKKLITGLKESPERWTAAMKEVNKVPANNLLERVAILARHGEDKAIAEGNFEAIVGKKFADITKEQATRPIKIEANPNPVSTVQKLEDFFTQYSDEALDNIANVKSTPIIVNKFSYENGVHQGQSKFIRDLGNAFKMEKTATGISLKSKVLDDAAVRRLAKDTKKYVGADKDAKYSVLKRTEQYYKSIGIDPKLAKKELKRQKAKITDDSLSASNVETEQVLDYGQSTGVFGQITRLRTNPYDEADAIIHKKISDRLSVVTKEGPLGDPVYRISEYPRKIEIGKKELGGGESSGVWDKTNYGVLGKDVVNGKGLEKAKTPRRKIDIRENDYFTPSDVEYLNSVMNRPVPFKVQRYISSTEPAKRELGLKYLYAKWLLNNDAKLGVEGKWLGRQVGSDEMNAIARQVKDLESITAAELDDDVLNLGLSKVLGDYSNKISQNNRMTLKNEESFRQMSDILGMTGKLLAASAVVVPTTLLATREDADAGLISSGSKILSSTIAMLVGEKGLAKEGIKVGSEKLAKLKKSGFIGDFGKDEFGSGIKHMKAPSVLKMNAGKGEAELFNTLGDPRPGIRGALDKMFRAIEPILTYGTRAGYYYKPMANPMVEFAGRQTVAAANAEMYEDAFLNIVKNIPTITKKSVDHVSKYMKDTARKWALEHETQNLHRVYLQQANDQMKALMRGVKGKKMAPEQKAMFEKYQADIAENGAKVSEIADRKIKIFEEEYIPKVKVLAKDHGDVRMFLAMEDKNFTKYPWLKSMMTPEEMTGVGRIDILYKKIAGEMEARGHKVIKKDFVHHALHPEFPYKEMAELYKINPEIGVARDIFAFNKIHSRMEGSLGMMPSMQYSNQKYVNDIFRRLEVKDFWASGWEDHAMRMKEIHPYSVGRMWNGFQNALKPFDDNLLNRSARTFYGANVAWYLAGSPSVAWKHILKQSAQVALFGVSPWLSNIKQAAGFAVRDKQADLLRTTGLRTQYGKIVGKDMNDTLHMFTTQGRFNNAIYDLNLQDMPRGVVDKMLHQFNQYGGIMVDSVEKMDRGMSVLMSLQMASKKGMTTQQAAYSVYDTILKTNFLSGAMNPYWLRSPTIRSFLMFAGTPFKILEQRLVRTMQAAKAGSRAYDEARKQITELGGLKEYIFNGEKQLKTELMMNALNSEKDIFGTPYTHQFMRNVLVLGAATYTGNKAFNANIWPHLFHLPGMEFGDGEMKLKTNPVIAAMVGATSRQRDDELWLNAFMRQSLGRTGYMPATMRKAIRLSNDDIPEMYKESKYRYLFSIPATGAGH